MPDCDTLVVDIGPNLLTLALQLPALVAAIAAALYARRSHALLLNGKAGKAP